MLTFTVKFDPSPIVTKLTNNREKAAHAIAAQAQKDTEPFTPALTGSMSQRTRVIGNEIIYPGPYARYLYYGKLMVDPNTGSAFAPKGQHKVLTLSLIHI